MQRRFDRQVGLFDRPFVERFPKPAPTFTERVRPESNGQVGKARDILAAIRALHSIENEHRQATVEERGILSRFGGFGAVATNLFPDQTGEYKDGSWKALGDELRSLLTDDEYRSAKATTFNAFYTSPIVVNAMRDAVTRLGVSDHASVLEPGCGQGNFMAHAPQGWKFIGVEMDSLSGRIARALHPQHDIRIEPFQNSRLPPVDLVIGNPPFANVNIEYRGQKFSLHDFFAAKSLDALRPGGVMAIVTSHFALDKQNGLARQYLASKADFLGAIRLPSDAFKKEGTSVVTDIIFMRKRGDEPEHHVDPEWLKASPMEVEGTRLSINNYFHNHPEMVLGTWSSKDRLYAEGYSVLSNGDLTTQLEEATRRIIARVPKHETNGHAEPEEIKPAFVPPPPVKHLTEGSFFVADDKSICQIENGQGIPVVYGGAALFSTGSMTGKRMAGLLNLRDKARRVLQSQNEGWPEEHRKRARVELNQAYDIFVHNYGPINKTSISETANGVIRRMPNVVKFREDPDAMLVLALEEYDEASGTAKKAAIMSRDVVGRNEPITRVNSAEEGLLVSLDQKGVVDLPFIASLYKKPEQEVISELADLIYLDPATQAWETADAYLSGNVREKLKIAEASGNQRNIDALKAVQPEDVLPGDISASLGAPWIPESDVQAFAAHLFGVAPNAISIGHLKTDAVWSVDANYEAEGSVAATTDYGTSRINGVSLLEQALNMKTPTIYDVVHNGDREERVVNQEQTIAAREKQKKIKEAFSNWIFSDPEREERLVRTYNDTYNNIRLRHFDGSHLDFPGMNQAFHLRDHQSDAVWRVMSAGNTLLGHVVGGGKSAIQAASVMKMRQAGLIRKAMCVCPNHLLEQYAREFQQLYPNAKLLIASKEDFTKEKRKFLTAKIASGDWDAIIVTHSSFERIGMSKEFQERFIRKQIDEYDQLLCETAGKNTGRGKRNLVKTIEKQKAARQEKLKNLLAEDKKDDGLVFDDLGVDHILYDESASVKNCEAPSKMERVAGIQTGGSERAFDMLMKAAYLHEKHPGHGITFANGTPISNSLVEMYTLMRFLSPEGLRERGIEHFDAWAATFGEVVEAMEISPDGKTLKPRSRFAKFVNLPELQQMFRSFADIQTAEMLNLPTPTLNGGKPEVIACPMSEDQLALQEGLVQRYERLRTQKVDPREDNALAITTAGRKLALDARLLDPNAPDFPDSKINRLAENVFDIWQKTEPKKGTQLIFSDLGVNPTPWGFCVYDEIIRKLIEKGIPKNQIAVMGDADSDAKKQVLFQKARSGEVRVLLGSTSKMGLGTNVQKRLVALHHLDAPWKPSEVEQRDGRILRQGNDNPEVSIYRYVTQGSFDSYVWQTLETKARFINQIMTGDTGVRQADDVAGQELTYAEVKAIASGNPAVLTLAEADAELQRLSVLKRNHADEQYLARRNVKELPQSIERLQNRIAAYEADMKTMNGNDDLLIAGRPAAEGALGDRLSTLPEKVDRPTQFNIGMFRGLSFGIEKSPFGADVFVTGQATRTERLSRDSQGPRAVMNALNRLASSYVGEIEEMKRSLSLSQNQLQDFEVRLGKPFTHAEYFDQLSSLRDRLKIALSSTPAEGEPTSGELAEQIKALRESHIVEAAPARTRSQTRRPDRPRPVRQHQPSTEEPRSTPEALTTLQPPTIEAPEERPSSPDPTPEPKPSPAPSFHQRVSKPRQRSLF